MSDSNELKINRLREITEMGKNQELLNKIGLAFRTLTLRRTRKGKDIQGASFKPYSAPYAKIRAKAGEPTHPVNLTMDHVSGMLEKITYQTNISGDAASVEAWINDSEKSKIGYYHAVSGAGVNKVVRKWWGLSNEDEEKIRKTVTNEFGKYLKAEL